MSLRLEAIKNAGDLNLERIRIRAVEDVDMGDYVVMRAASKDGIPRSGPAECYWLVDKEIKAQDLIVIYSKSGRSTEKKNPSGNTTYFFYWRSSVPLWLPDRVAVLLKSSGFNTLPVHDPQSDDIEPDTTAT